MAKKKAIKLAAASAVAASAFVAAAPAQTDAASNVAVEVSKAVTQMKKAYHTYSDVTAQGKFAPIADVYKEYNAAKKAYANAKALVNKAGGADKDKHLAALEDTYAEYIAKRVITYIDAYNYATTLQDKQIALEEALKNKDWDAAEKQYHAISYELKTRTVILDRVYGKSTRELLRGSFKADAQAARDSIQNEVSVKIYFDKAEGLLNDGKLEEAKAAMDHVADYVAKLDKDTDFGAALLAKVAAAKEKYEELSVPAVKSVSAINATQVEVKFNKVLDGSDFDTQAEAAAKFKLTGETVVSADLSDDKKTVTVTFAGSIEDTNDEFIVEPVMTTAKDANNQPVRTLKHVQVFTFKDTVKPEIVSVTSKSKANTATSLTVVASEPIQSAVAKINGSYVTVNFGGTDTATITGLNLDASKEHTLELINLTDKAATPNVTVSTSMKFNVTVDATAPALASVSTASEKEILLTFSKKMSEATLESAFAAGAGLGLVKDETLSNLQLGSYGGTTGYVKEVAGSNGTKFTVQVSASLFANKTTRNLTVLLPDTITDSLGNKLAVTTQAVTLTKDTTKPVATGYRLVKDSQDRVTHIEVDFSEGLAAGTTPALPTIVNENGVAVSAGSFLGGLSATTTAAGDKKVVYAATVPAKVAGKYAFSFASNLVNDQAETANKSDAFNYTIDFGTSNATFNLTSAAATSPTSNTIAVNFGTAVRGGAVSNSATDVNNYTLAGRPLPAGTTITLNAAQTVATIVLPAESVVTTDATAVFTVANVDSLTGAKLNAYNGTVAISDNVKPVLASGALTADNKLALGFSEALQTGPAITDLVIKVNGSAVTATATGGGTNLAVSAGTGSDAGKYLVNLDALVKQGNAAIPAVEDDPATPADETAAAVPATPTYVDINNNNVYDAATDIKLGDGPVSGFKFSTSALITGVTVSTVAAPTVPTAQDAALNKLTNGTTVTAK